MSDLVTVREETSDVVSSNLEANAKDAFRLPERNWSLIINEYNSKSDKKFTISPLECKVILEQVKRGQLPKIVLEAIGYTYQKYTFMVQKADMLEEEIERIKAKEKLTDEDVTQLQAAIKHPVRLLIHDIKRAQALCSLVEWEKFNEMAHNMPDMKAMQMRAKYKEVFAEKEQQTGGYNVQIKIGGDWVDKI